MKYIIYLFFRYYDKGTTKQIAFLKSVSCFMFLLFMNIVTILLFIAPTFLQSFHFSSKGQSSIFFLVLFGIGYFIIKQIVPEEKIRAFSPNKNVRLHGWFLFLYVFSSIIFMTLALINLRNV